MHRYRRVISCFVKKTFFVMLSKLKLIPGRERVSLGMKGLGDSSYVRDLASPDS